MFNCVWGNLKVPSRVKGLKFSTLMLTTYIYFKVAHSNKHAKWRYYRILSLHCDVFIHSTLNDRHEISQTLQLRLFVNWRAESNPHFIYIFKTRCLPAGDRRSPRYSRSDFHTDAKRRRRPGRNRH